MGLSETKTLFAKTFQEWKEDDALQWGAALSYYTALSLAPLLMLLITVAGFFLDEAAAQQQLVTQLESWMGSAGGDVARSVFENQNDGGGGWMGGISSTVLLIFGASGIFWQLQKALNDLWEVEPVKGGIKYLLRGRLVGFAMVLGLGILLFAAVILQSVITAVTSGPLGSVLNLGASLFVFTLLFAAIFKVLPDVDIRWKEVWIGAAFTALLFVIGQFVIGLYLGNASPGSAYGAAGSLIALLIWIYYSSQTVFFGAEFTQVWARRRGRRIEPEKGARRIVIKRIGQEDQDGAPTGGDGGRGRGDEKRRGAPAGDGKGRGESGGTPAGAEDEPEPAERKGRGAAYP